MCLQTALDARCRAPVEPAGVAVGSAPGGRLPGLGRRTANQTSVVSRTAIGTHRGFGRGAAPRPGRQLTQTHRVAVATPARKGK